MIDISAARHSYTEVEITDVGLVRSEHNVADGLTKMSFGKALEDVMKTGMDTRIQSRSGSYMDPSLRLKKSRECESS